MESHCGLRDESRTDKSCCKDAKGFCPARKAKRTTRVGSGERPPPRLFGQGTTHCFEHASPYRRMIGVLTTTLSFALSLFERFTSSHLRYERRAERFLVIGDDGIYLQCLCRHSDSPIFVIGLIGLQCLKDESAGQVH